MKHEAVAVPVLLAFSQWTNSNFMELIYTDILAKSTVKWRNNL